MLAQRMNMIDSSGIRKVFNLAAKLENPINLSIGQPDFDVSDEVKEAAINAIRAGVNKYTLTAGMPDFQNQIMDKLKETRGIDFESVIITSGVSGGILLAFLALLNPGDEVLVPDPYFVMYKHLANFLGAKPVYIDTYPDFKLREEALEAAVTPKTKVLLLNSPSNPTGATYDEESLKMISNFVKKHNIQLITDEIYESFCYDSEYKSILPYCPEALLLSGFSKCAAMTGWRLGYAAGPKHIVDAMTQIQQYTFVCAPSMVQEAGKVALMMEMEQQRENYKRKRDLIYNGLKDYYEVEKPGGAFYIFPKAPNGDGDAFVEECIKNSLLVVPGSVFSEKKTHFRLSYAATDETIERGIEVLQKLAK